MGSQQQQSQLRQCQIGYERRILVGQLEGPDHVAVQLLAHRVLFGELEDELEAVYEVAYELSDEEADYDPVVESAALRDELAVEEEDD